MSSNAVGSPSAGPYQTPPPMVAEMSLTLDEAIHYSRIWLQRFQPLNNKGGKLAGRIEGAERDLN
jgi:hypothetical protein